MRLAASAATSSRQRVQGIVCRWWVVCGFVCGFVCRFVCGFWPSLPGPTAGAPRHTQPVFGGVDHIAPIDVNRSDASLSPSARSLISELRTRTAEARIHLFDLHDPHQRTAHVVLPEQGLALPGLTLICPDSHTGTPSQ